MNQPPTIPETEDEEKVTPLRVITGGRSGPGFNWLMTLPKGTIFACRERTNRDFNLAEFHVEWKFLRSVRLFSNMQQEIHILVDSMRFSEQFELVDIIFEGQE